MQHSWEDPECAPARGSLHSWEQPSNGETDSDHTADSDDELENPEDEFVQYCTMLLLARHLTAVQFSTLMFHAGNAGIKTAKKLGLRPSVQNGGHAQRKINAHTGRREDIKQVYMLEMPSYDRRAMSRSSRQIPVFAPHEQIEHHLTSASVLRTQLLEAMDDGNLPDCYYDHPIVKKYGSRRDPVRPLCLYLDGVPYSNTDGVLCVWIECFLEGTRHPVAVLRKKSMCRCGCRGWCSLFELFSYLRWSIQAMSEKRYPRARHTGPWLPSDVSRQALAGERLSMRSCILYIKGDWAEYAASIGLPTWQDAARPCYCCNAPGGDELHSHEGAGKHSFPHRENIEGDYFAACDRCEIVIWMSEEDRQLVLHEGVLRYDRRPSGSHGRTLQHDVPSLNLMRDDRLEPSPELADVGKFETIDLSSPVRIVWWRPSRESLARHRNPLFSMALGVTVWRSLTPDTLHVLYLGVFHSVCKLIVWELILKHAWGGQFGTQEDLVEVALNVFHNSLTVWYKRRARMFPNEQITRISDVTRKMVGDPANQRLKTKGAETWGLLLYLVDEIPLHMDKLGDTGPLLLEAATCLKEMALVFDRSGIRLSEDDQDQCWNYYLRFLDASKDFPQLLLPKRHLTLHLLRRMDVFGNPRFYAAWKDEGLNKTLKACCRKVSQATFEISVLSNVKRLLSMQADGRKRKIAA